MSEDCDVEDIARILEDETARTILTEVNVEPMSATALSDRCDASPPTIYRRLDDLRACDLIVERTAVDPVDGHHRKVYATTLDRVTVNLDGDRFDLRIDRRERMADRFTRLVEDM